MSAEEKVMKTLNNVKGRFLEDTRGIFVKRGERNETVFLLPDKERVNDARALVRRRADASQSFSMGGSRWGLWDRWCGECQEKCSVFNFMQTMQPLTCVMSVWKSADAAGVTA